MASTQGQRQLTPLKPGTPLIAVEHLSRTIITRAQRTTILDDVTFVVAAQSLFAITGSSGSGKTTLLNVLTGIDRPTSGSVLVAGEALPNKGENALARWRGRHVGIIFQFFQLIPTLTALENVLLALELGGGGGLSRRAWRDRALHCLDLVDMRAYARRLPSALSGGQQQRVAIARALANDPPLLVADEPTGNLDSHSAAAVFEVLAGLTERGKTLMRASAGIDLLDGRIVRRHNLSSASQEVSQ